MSGITHRHALIVLNRGNTYIFLNNEFYLSILQIILQILSHSTNIINPFRKSIINYNLPNIELNIMQIITQMIILRKYTLYI